MALDFVQTVAFAGLVLFGGYWLKRRIPLLARYNIPAPVVGGIPVATVLAVLFRIDALSIVTVPGPPALVIARKMPPPGPPRAVASVVLPPSAAGVSVAESAHAERAPFHSSRR